MSSFRERWGYKGKETSINGVSNYLFEKGFLRDKGVNKKMQELGNIAREFLIENNLPVRMKKSNYDIDKNCKTIQTVFQKFAEFIKNKQSSLTTKID